jgi:hypothetical protein
MFAFILLAAGMMAGAAVAQEEAPAPEVSVAEGPPADLFAERPIIEGLWEFTAYPLRRGEIRIGNLSLPFDPRQLRWLYLDVGLTEGLQLGTAVPADLTGMVNLVGKFRFLHLESGLALALPFRLDLTVRPERDLMLGSGLIASWALQDGITVHGGLWLTLSRGQKASLSALYAILDTTILPDTKLIIEMDAYPSAANQFLVSVGTLRRIGVLNFRVTTAVLFPGMSNRLTADLFVRF